jgi:ketosteroid isomerase-like protein
MSQENVEIVRRAVDAWNRGDLNAWLECFDEDIVWNPLPDAPDLKPIHGRQAVLELMQRWLEPWDRYELETLELVDLGGVIIWTARHLAFQKRTEMALDQTMSAVCAFREDAIAEFHMFPSRDQALQAAGLSE